MAVYYYVLKINFKTIYTCLSDRVKPLYKETGEFLIYISV